MSILPREFKENRNFCVEIFFTKSLQKQNLMKLFLYMVKEVTFIITVIIYF